MAVLVVVAGLVRRPARETATRAVVAAAALVPFIWFEIASNHSQIHAWFTYRSIPMAIGVVLMTSLATQPAALSSSDSEPAST